MPKIPWFCSLRITKQSRKFRNRLAKHNVTKLASDFSLHELFSTSRVELVTITKYIYRPPFLALLLVLHLFFKWVLFTPVVDLKKKKIWDTFYQMQNENTHFFVNSKVHIVWFLFYNPRKWNLCLQNHTHYSMKYLCTRKIHFIFGITSAFASISSTYVLDSGHFIDLYIDGHSIEEATARPR